MEKVQYQDVIIVGAGISGITCAYRVQQNMPSYSYAVLEARNAMGGTWDFFKYPGLRSDSDLHTFGFPFRPWPNPKSIADGASIRDYIEETAKMYGIDRQIRYNHKLEALNWDSKKQRWFLTVDANGSTTTFCARFVIVSTGYYDYKTPLQANIEGLQNFKGQVIHPQFWPKDFDYTNKKMVIIGSGATAITLLPVLAEKAAHVTMLQRSPTYLLTLLNKEKGGLIARFLPAWLAHRLTRYYFLIFPFIFFKFCRAFPNVARRLLRLATQRQLPASVPHNPHFEPKYNPWEQRLCVCPNGDFFAALHTGKADVATGSIKTMTDKSIILQSGQTLDADVIVTATGLKLLLAGGAAVSIDGQALNIGDKFMWKGIMLQDVPNLGFVMGYTNASWTLGADCTARLVTRIMAYMKQHGITSAAPRLENPKSQKALPVLNLNSTYVVKAMNMLPLTGDKGPWRARDNYFADYCDAKWGNITEGIEYTTGAV